MRKARWAYLLEDDPEFWRWYDNLKRSVGTANERARVLYRFLTIHDNEGYDDDASVARTLYGALGIDPLRIDTLTRTTENGDPKKIVGEDELARHLTEEWDVQTVLPSGKILIRK